MTVVADKVIFLVVDDDEDIREILCSYLNRFDVTILEAANGIEAYEISQQKNVDIIISDIRMPGGCGIVLLDRIKAKNAIKPFVVLMTGHSEFTLSEIYGKGADGVITKPFKLDVIKEMVECFLKEGKFKWLK